MPRPSPPTWRSRRSWPAPRRRSCRWTGRTRASRHRWVVASTARCRNLHHVAGRRWTKTPWDAPASETYTPPLGDRVDAALDALAADPEPYTPQLGGRVDAALDALVGDDVGGQQFASTGAPSGRRRRPRRRRRTPRRHARWTSSRPRSRTSSSRKRASTNRASSASTAGPSTTVQPWTEDFLDFIEEQEEEEIEFYDERLGVVPSHELIEVDEDGKPHHGDGPRGRGRGDDHGGHFDLSRVLYSFCPVGRAWSLEQERAEVMTQYNFKSRLVGNDGFLYAEGGGQSQDISTGSMLRCNNCPSNECEDCPMLYGHRRGDRACRSPRRMFGIGCQRVFAATVPRTAAWVSPGDRIPRIFEDTSGKTERDGTLSSSGRRRAAERLGLAARERARVSGAPDVVLKRYARLLRSPLYRPRVGHHRASSLMVGI